MSTQPTPLPVGSTLDGDLAEDSPEELAEEAAELGRIISRQKRLDWLAIQAIRVVVVAAFVLLWEWASGTIVRSFWISEPSAISARFWEWVVDGTVLKHSVSTLQAAALGFLGGSIAGIVVGLLLGIFSFLARIFEPFLTAIYSLPKLAFAPLFILWFGIGLASKVLLTAAICFFLVFFNTFAGVRSVDEDLLDVVRVLGARRWDMIRKVVLPSATAWIFTGLRIAVPYALVGAVVGELIASSQGLGWLLSRASGTFDTTGTFAALLVLLCVAILVNGAVKQLESRASRWMRVEGRGTGLGTSGTAV